MEIVKELIIISEPLFSKIDDISNSNEIMGDNIFQTHKYIPAVFWGNYYGEKYVNQYGKDKLLNSKIGITENVGNGIMITMNNDLLAFNNEECIKNRKNLSKYLGINQPKILDIFKRA